MDKSCYCFVTRCSSLMTTHKSGLVFVPVNGKWENVIIIIYDRFKYRKCSMVEKLYRTRVK